jgi:hypothetical protein
MRWLSGPSPSAVTEALRAVVPELSGLPVDIPDPAGRDDPVWQSSSAVLGEDFFVKFAWSETAARRVLRQIRVLDALAREPAVPYLPQVVASGTDPLIMVTRRVRGASLFAVADFIDLDHAGRQNVSLWELAPAFFVIGVGIGLSFATIPVVALGDAKPDEAGSASGSFSSIQQLASAIGSAAVTSIFFQAATSGLGHAMEVTLIVVLAVTAFTLPVVALMPRKAPAEPHQ